jgi:hypothetical protein
MTFLFLFAPYAIALTAVDRAMLGPEAVLCAPGVSW